MIDRGPYYHIVWMTPDKFLDAVDPEFEPDVEQGNPWLRERMLEGSAFAPLQVHADSFEHWLRFPREISDDRPPVRQHEGRNRAWIARDLGVKKVPVVVWLDMDDARDAKAKGYFLDRVNWPDPVDLHRSLSYDDEHPDWASGSKAYTRALLGEMRSPRKTENPRKGKKMAKAKAKPEWKRLIERCQRLWAAYDRKPTKANLEKFGAHIEKMKASKSIKVKSERTRAARAFRQQWKAAGYHMPAKRKATKRKATKRKNPTPVNQDLRESLHLMDTDSVRMFYDRHRELYEGSDDPKRDFGVVGVKMIRAYIKDSKADLKRRGVKLPNPGHRPASDLPPPIFGLEGPFRFKTGFVLYYDPKEGKYYDRGRDMYLSLEEAEAAIGNPGKHKTTKRKTAKRKVNPGWGRPDEEFRLGVKRMTDVRLEMSYLNVRDRLRADDYPFRLGDNSREFDEEMLRIMGREMYRRGLAVNPAKRKTTKKKASKRKATKRKTAKRKPKKKVARRHKNPSSRRGELLNGWESLGGNEWVKDIGGRKWWVGWENVTDMDKGEAFVYEYSYGLYGDRNRPQRLRRKELRSDDWIEPSQILDIVEEGVGLVPGLGQASYREEAGPFRAEPVGEEGDEWQIIVDRAAWDNPKRKKTNAFTAAQNKKLRLGWGKMKPGFIISEAVNAKPILALAVYKKGSKWGSAVIDKRGEFVKLIEPFKRSSAFAAAKAAEDTVLNKPKRKTTKRKATARKKKMKA